MSRLAAILGLVLAFGRPALALNLNTADGDLPMSAASQGTGALMTGYDIFRVFVNPALLTNQPRTWELGLASSLMFDGDENVWNVGCGWAGGKTDTGSFGAAVLLTGMSIGEFSELDLLGNETGRAVAPSMIGGEIAVGYQWQFVSFGGAFGLTTWSLGGRIGDAVKGFENQTSGPVPFGHFGAAVELGLIDLGAYFRLGNMTGVGLGLAIRTGGVMQGALAGEIFLPTMGPALTSGPAFMFNGGSTGGSNSSGSSGAYPGSFGIGYEWQALKVVNLRVGVLGNGSGVSGGGPEIRLGFGVPWKTLAFDYAFTMGSVGTLATGNSHTASLRWMLGSERKQAEGPKFFLKQEERTLAVAAFEPQGVSATDAAVISDMLRNRLIKEGSFNIVEKAYMDRILAEQAFQQTGCTSAECAVKIGKVLNVRYLVVGSFGKALDRYVLSMRVVDVESAKGVYSDEATGANLTEIQTGLDQIAIRLTEAVKNAK